MQAEQTKPRKIDAEALRSLSDLDRTLREHIDALFAIPCESDVAAEAITMAINAAEAALARVRAAKRQLFQGDAAETPLQRSE